MNFSYYVNDPLPFSYCGTDICEFEKNKAFSKGWTYAGQQPSNMILYIYSNWLMYTQKKQVSVICLKYLSTIHCALQKLNATTKLQTVMI